MIARNERGQSSAEYIGMILLVAVVIAAIATSGIASSISGGIRDAQCTLTGSQCETGSHGAGATSARELAARTGPRRFSPADRILDRLELYKRLSAGNRGDLVNSLVSGADSDFDALVAQGTIDGERSNSRFFRVPRSPGDGIIAMDYFIPAGSRAGLLVSGERGDRARFTVLTLTYGP